MIKLLIAGLLVLGAQELAGAKALFHAPAGPQCGIHYWLQAEDGQRLTERQARSRSGKFTLHVRNNIASGFLTIWDLSRDRELTPRVDPRWSGFIMSDQVYVVPGTFEFTAGESASHLVIVWALSQTEVARDPADARLRLRQMPAAWPIVTEVDESTPGQVGTYVVNRRDAGVAAEIVFRASPGANDAQSSRPSRRTSGQ